MNRADRIVAQRESAAAKAKVDAQAAAVAAVRDRRTAAWKELLALTGPARAALDARGWPDATMVNLQRTRLFGGSKAAPKAGRQLTTHPSGAPDGAPVYLLSDGRLAIDGRGPPTVLKGNFVEFIIADTGAWAGFPFPEVKRALERIVAGA